VITRVFGHIVPPFAISLLFERKKAKDAATVGAKRKHLAFLLSLQRKQ
jgi:hypothetical protein